MTPDLNFWGRLVGILGGEMALVVAVTAFIAASVRAPQIRRAVWQASLVALAAAGVMELTGLRGWRLPWQSAPAPPVKHRLVATVRAPVEPAFETKTEAAPPSWTIQSRLVAPPARTPVWWPGQLWLLGTVLLGIRALTLRGWLARQRRRAETGDSDTQEMVEGLKRSLASRV